VLARRLADAPGAGKQVPRNIGGPVKILCAGEIALLVAAMGTVANAGENSLRGGTWALQFSITENFTVDNFNQFGVSLKRHFTSGSALRGGITLGAHDAHVEASIGTLMSTVDSDVQSYEFGVGYMWYPNPDATVNVYFGAGPQFLFSSDDRHNELTNGETSSNKRSVWGVGVNGFMGVEWFAMESLGIHAEYGFTWNYRSDTLENSTSSESTQKSELTQWSLAFDDVRFGLSVYF
jgi:hypothetical protein